jgi:hypothetical protein
MALSKLLDAIPFGSFVGVALNLAGEPVKAWLTDVRTRRAFDDAVKHACWAFDARHPELSDEFFDQTFVENNVAPLLAEFLVTRGQLPTPERIVEIWRARYHFEDTQNRMVPYAGDFIREVGRQIVAQPLLRQYVTEGQLDRAVVLLEEVRSISISLADAARREQLQEALDRLMYAALTYELAARLMLDHADAVEIAIQQRNAQAAFESARRRLERLEYVTARSLLADFEGFVRSPFFAIVDALADGSGSEIRLSDLSDGVSRMEQSLRAAP